MMATANSNSTSASSNDLKQNGVYDPLLIQIVLKVFPKSMQLQRDLAELAKVSPNYVSQVKNRQETNPSGDYWINLCETLNNPDLVSIVWKDFVPVQAHLKTPPAKRIRKATALKNAPHPFYFFPKNVGDQAAFTQILELAILVDKKKIHVIRRLDFSALQAELAQRSEDHITEEVEMLSFDEIKDQRKEFWTKLEKLNNSVEVSKAKKWRIVINGQACSMIIVHRSSSLRKRLAEVIQSECVGSIMSMIEVPSDVELAGPSNPKTRKLHDKGDTNDNGAELNQNTKQEKPFPYPSQIDIAEQLYGMILGKMKQTQNVSADAALLKQFSDIKFLILLPKLVSLEDQTNQRLKEASNHYKGIIRLSEADNIVRLGTQSSSAKKDWDNFIKSAIKNKHIFHLVIHDECHWAAGQNQVNFKFLDFDKGDYHNHEGKLLPNLFTLLVSATPYNFFTAKFLTSKDILSWPINSGDNAYKGLSELRKAKKIKSKQMNQKSWDDVESRFQAEVLNGFPVPFLQVISDYLAALYSYAHPDAEGLPATEEAKDSVRKCIEEGKLIVIRLCSAKDDIRQALVAKEVLLMARDILKLKFEVMVHSAETSKGDADNFLTEHQKILRKNALTRLGIEDDGSSNVNIPYQFLSDVENIPMFMIIIEKGRMGDTFASTCVTFDLRSRYNVTIDNFTTIVQDAGRAFGYGERPNLLLSRFADRFLKHIWDTEANEINWESLKKNLPKGALLGPHMAKVAVTVDDASNLEPSNMLLELFRQHFIAQQNNKVCLYDLGEESFKHRAILKAHPQIGKTGAFIYLIYLFCKEFRNPNVEMVRNELEKFSATMYREWSLEKIAEEWQKDGGKAHRHYLQDLLPYSREKRKQDGLLEPAQWAARSLLEDLTKPFPASESKETQISVADFGCGDMEFAKFLITEFEAMPKDGKLGNVIFHLHGYDISPSEISTIDLPMSANFKIHCHPGTNCGDEESFETESFDYIISTLALFGSRDSWKATVKAAFHALKTGRKLFLAEFYNHLPIETLVLLSKAGIDAEKPSKTVCGGFAQFRAFTEEFNAMVCVKTEDYDASSLYDSLPSRYKVEQDQE